MANARYYSSVAPPTTLTGGVGPTNTTIQLVSTSGLPGSLPFTLSLDYGAANEELVDVTAVGGLTLTVTRGVDGTSASTHNVGAVVRHVTSARDFTESRTHEASVAAVHGVTSTIVGTTDTQTLSNKTLINATGSLQNVDIFNKGAFVTSIIGDSTNPGINRLTVLDNEINLNTMALIGSNGLIASLNLASDTNNNYKFRVIDTDGTTSRFFVLAGGNANVAPNTTTTFPAFDIVAPDQVTTKRAMRIAGPSGVNERFTIWNDGHVDVAGTVPTVSQFDILAAPSQTASIFRVQTSGASTLAEVQNTGRFAAAVGATVSQTGVASGNVLVVGSLNAGYTGSLTQWLGPAGTQVAAVDQAGNFTSAGALSASNLTTWQNFTPTWSGFTTLGTGFSSTGRWCLIGNTVHVIAQVTAGTSPSLGTGTITVTLPVNASSTPTGSLGWQGTGRHNPLDGSSFKSLIPHVNPGGSTATIFGIRQSDLGWVSPGTAGNVWIAGSNMRIQVQYEV